MPPPEKLKTQIANTILDADGDRRTGVTLYAISTFLEWWGHQKKKIL